MAFNDNSPPAPKKKLGVKLNNDNSMFANIPKKPSQQDLIKTVNQIQEKSQNYKQRANELSLAFLKILEDKTLPENKNIFQGDLEKETIGKLGQLALDLNQDENEPEGIGSVGLINLLFRCLLIQRDKINNLNYIITQKLPTLDNSK